MQQSKPDRKKSRGDRDDESSFKRLGGRNLRAEDQANESDDGAGREEESDDAGAGDEGPDMSDRADAGLKAASHLGKAASGGKLRMAWSLWRASKQLPVAASGAGNLVKRHPAIAALIGGVTTAAAIYVLASRAASATEGGESSDADAGAQAGHDDQAEGQAQDQSDSPAASEGDERGGAEEQEPPRRAQKRKSRA